jgi:excisionase family DNA binding protein
MQQIENPFATILEKISGLENQIKHLKGQQAPKPEPDFMTVDQAAQYLDLSKSTIYKNVHFGKLPYYKSGKKLYFRKSEIKQIIEQSKIDKV